MSKVKKNRETSKSNKMDRINHEAELKNLDNDDETSEAEEVNWTKRDKQTLLLALKMHGENDIPAICGKLPHMSETAIKRKISIYSALAEHLYTNKILNNWLSSGMCRRKILADAILFICLFGKHPSSSACKGLNFRKVYEIVYKAFTNKIEPRTLLRKKEAILIWKLLTELDKTVWPQFMDELFSYLGKNYKKRNIFKTYEKKKVGKTL